MEEIDFTTNMGLIEEINYDIQEEVEEGIDKRKKIHLPGTGLHISEFAQNLANEIKDKDKLFYRKDISEVVEITEDGFKIMKSNRFITVIEKYFRPYITIVKKRGELEDRDKSMNQQIASIILASPNLQDNIKRIKRIFPVPLPIIHKGKLTFPIKGYDERFESWLDYDTPTINENITLEEAKNKINSIYEEFCFQENQDKINAIAGLITPFLRGLFSNFNVRTPMFCYMANRERAGKDYCAGITGIILEGEKLEETPISSGEFRASGGNDELRKKFVSSLIAGKKRMHFANNKGKLNNAVLEGFLTATVFSDRLLGKNESVTFDNEMDVSISGNIGMTFTPDLANRGRFIRLFLEMEDANEREFENPNLHETILEERDLILSCIYALIKNWFKNGKPKGSIPFSSFPEWADICGGIMECVDLGNPCVKDKSIQGIGVDEETDEMKHLFEFINEIKPNGWLKKKDIQKYIRDSEDDMFHYIDWDKKSDQIKFGLKLKKFVGRILSDIRLVVKDKNVRSQRWEYKFIKEKSGHVGHVGHDIPSVENTGRNFMINNWYRGNMPNMANMTNILDYFKENKEKSCSYNEIEGLFGGCVEILEKLKSEGIIFEPRSRIYRWLG